MLNRMREEKFEIISILDDIRWDKRTYDVDGSNINYAHNSLTDEQKILTHWLTYITDRQMPYEVIWKVGGFVISDLVHDFINHTPVKALLLPESTGSMVEKFGENDKRNPIYAIKSSSLANNIIEVDYPSYMLDDGHVKFSSRFYPTDILCMVYTLSILEKDYNNSIIDYISVIINTIYNMGNSSTKKYIESIACGLNLLTYNNVHQVSSKNLRSVILNYCEDKALSNYCTLAERSNEIKKWIRNDCNGSLSDDARYKSSKRLWCSIRDYIKSPIFSPYFKSALKTKLDINVFNDFNSKVLDNNIGCRHIELPGDLWNEDSKFRNCFDLYDSKETKGKFGKHLRKLWDSADSWYPEQFDVTFDYVQRMCDPGHCNICLLNESKNSKEMLKYCHDTAGKYCPLVLLHCGYNHVCQGINTCKLSNYMK